MPRKHHGYTYFGLVKIKEQFYHTMLQMSSVRDRVRRYDGDSNVPRTTSCCHNLVFYFAAICHLQCCFSLGLESTSNQRYNQRPHVNTSVQDLHI